jgi:hypothetical protein
LLGIWKFGFSVKEIHLSYSYIDIYNCRMLYFFHVHKIVVLLILLPCHLPDKKAPIVVKISYSLMLARQNIVAECTESQDLWGSTFQHLRTVPGRCTYPCVFVVDSIDEGKAEHHCYGA